MGQRSKASGSRVKVDLSDVPALLPQHSARMDAAGIHPLVAKCRGYQSVANLVDAQVLGLGDEFSARQLRRLPALFIPAHSLNGQGASQLRPDDPRRDKKGRSIKYESPKGSIPTLDVHPFVQWALGLINDPEIAQAAGQVGVTRTDHPTVALVESRQKADAFLSRGILAIALQGVWSWWDKNARDVRPDFDEIPWNGMTVVLVPDSNITTLDVHKAARWLMYELQGRNTTVTCKQIPKRTNGRDQGPDDWLGHDKTAENFWELPDYDLDRPHLQDPEYRRSKYDELKRMQAREELNLERAAETFTTPTWTIGQPKHQPRVPWAISRLHAEGTNTVLAGIFKSRKTTVALNLARRLLLDKHFLGRPVGPIPEGKSVAHLNFELDEDMFEAEAKLIGVPLERFARMHLRDHRLPITASIGHDTLVEFLREVRAHWLIVDPFRRSLTDCGLRENDNDEVTEWARMLDIIKRETDCPNALIIAHAGQDDLIERKKERARGATALKDWADNLWYLDVRLSGDRWLIAQHIRRGPEKLEIQLTSDPKTHRIALAGGVSRDEEDRLALAAQAALMCEKNPDINATELRNLVGGRKEDRALAITTAIREGWIEWSPGPGTSKLHRAAKRREWIEYLPKGV